MPSTSRPLVYLFTYHWHVGGSSDNRQVRSTKKSWLFLHVWLDEKTTKQKQKHLAESLLWVPWRSYDDDKERVSRCAISLVGEYTGSACCLAGFHSLGNPRVANDSGSIEEQGFDQATE